MDTALGVMVGLVVVLVVAMVVATLLRRRRRRHEEHQLAHADELRGFAAGRTSDVAAASSRARQADAEADQARARAVQAEQAAADAHRDLARVEAEQEGAVREADELDPRVDTRARDYRPITGPAMKTGTGAPITDDEHQTGGSHRA